MFCSSLLRAACNDKQAHRRIESGAPMLLRRKEKQSIRKLYPADFFTFISRYICKISEESGNEYIYVAFNSFHVDRRRSINALCSDRNAALLNMEIYEKRKIGAWNDRLNCKDRWFDYCCRRNALGDPV